MDFESCMAWAEKADAVELRLDLCPPFSPDQMRELTWSGCQWIATCRPGAMPDEARYACLSQAMICGATFIDVEKNAEKAYREALMHTARQFSCNVIISHHDTEGTPDDKTLQRIIREAFALGADYVKLVTAVQTPDDTVRLLRLYEQFDQLIAFGMGPESRDSRVRAAADSVFTYVAPDSAHRTAPGQLIWEEALALDLDKE